jgi:SRSO17 transposase
MLPECRQTDFLYAIPEFTVEKRDVEAFVEELKRFHGRFSVCFLRPEPREQSYQYLVGRFSSLARKTIEPIAVHLAGRGTVRALQRSISDARWDEARAMGRYHEMVAEEMGEPDGVLTFDESGSVKKGGDSAGVARQYCGRIGKVENCQVGVFAGYASRQGYALVDKRLYVPEQWFSEGYREKRQKCQMPKDLGFETKPQQAAEMLLAIDRQGILPFKYIVADTIYGDNMEFIEAAEQCLGKTYFVSIPSDTQCWLQRPLTKGKTYRYHGELRTKRVLKAPKKAPMTVAQFAEGVHDHFWYTRTVSEGTKGPITYEFTRRQVTLARKGLPWKTVWLVIKRTIEDEPTSWYYVSNASTSARLGLFVWLSGRRWAIEQCFEEANQEVGLDQYEVRKYPGWQRHMFFCLLAYFFLWHVKLRLGKKSAMFDSAPGEGAPQNGAATSNIFVGRGDRSCPMDSSEESPGVSVS